MRGDAGVKQLQSAPPRSVADLGPIEEVLPEYLVPNVTVYGTPEEDIPADEPTEPKTYIVIDEMGEKEYIR
jgi:hypothetical protein